MGFSGSPQRWNGVLTLTRLGDLTHVTYPDLVFERSEIQYIACSSKLFQYGSLIDSTTNSEQQHATYKVITDKKLDCSCSLAAVVKGAIICYKQA